MTTRKQIQKGYMAPAADTADFFLKDGDRVVVITTGSPSQASARRNRNQMIGTVKSESLVSEQNS